MRADVFEDLEREYEALDAMLASLDHDAWTVGSLCRGWSVADVVLHLAQTEEGLLVSVGLRAPSPSAMARASRRSMGTIDSVVEEWVDSERGVSADERFERWRTASREGLAALRAADPDTPIAWATNPIKPRTLATTRLSEHWIHANDIARPLGISYPDTARLRHIAHLAHRTIPYAYRLAGRDDPPVTRIELTAPDGDAWALGPEGAEVVVRGSASEFCRIAARRLEPADARSIVTTSERGQELLELVRTYA